MRQLARVRTNSCRTGFVVVRGDWATWAAHRAWSRRRSRCCQLMSATVIAVSKYVRPCFQAWDQAWWCYGRARCSSEGGVYEPRRRGEAELIGDTQDVDSWRLWRTTGLLITSVGVEVARSLAMHVLSEVASSVISSTTTTVSESAPVTHGRRSTTSQSPARCIDLDDGDVLLSCIVTLQRFLQYFSCAQFPFSLACYEELQISRQGKVGNRPLHIYYIHPRYATR
jgi:hypothetical protein